MHSPNPAVASHFVKSVLAYLDGMHKLATMLNDRAAREHFEECWSIVWRAYYGGYSLPRYVSPCVQPAQSQPVPTSKPPWYVAKFARPTRKVVARTSERIDMGKRYPTLTVYFDVLECGHRLEGNQNNGAAAPARHRRCPHCEPCTTTQQTHTGRETSPPSKARASAY